MRLWPMVFAVGLLVACESAVPPLPAADHIYTTRGVVERLPARNDAHILILHQEVPGFVGMDGAITTMESMSMPFALAGGVSMAEVKEGTKVEFTFEVRCKGAEPLLITALRPLPAETTLDFAK